MKAVGLVGLRRAPSWRWGEGIEGVPRHPKLHRPSRAQYGGRLEGHLGVQLNLMGRHVLESSSSDGGCFFFFLFGNSHLHNKVTALVLGSPSQMEETQFAY